MTLTQPYYKFVITQVTVLVYQLEVFSKLSSMSLGTDVSNVTSEQRASKASTEIQVLASRAEYVSDLRRPQPVTVHLLALGPE